MEQSHSEATAATEPGSVVRSCRSCKKPLTEARLKAMPHASLCVTCLQRKGDVITIKRYDEYVGSEEVQTYFKQPNQYLREQLERRLDFMSKGMFGQRAA